jgi:hypothetical protein
MTDAPLIAAQVLQAYTGLPATSILIVDNGVNYTAPKDGTYITIQPRDPRVVGLSARHNNSNSKEKIVQTIYQVLTIEVCSRDASAQDNHFKALAAFSSAIAAEAGEKAGLRFFRPSNALNLSEIEGVAPLRRFRFDVTMSMTVQTEAPQAIYTQFPIGGSKVE